MSGDRLAPVLLCSASLLGLSAPALAEGVCQPKGEGRGRECFVAPDGSDDGSGSQSSPYRTIGHALEVLEAGDVLTLRHGAYVGSVTVGATNGTAAAPIVIRSFPGERASIDASLAEFRVRGNTEWEPASRWDAGAHRDEYVSIQSFTEGVVGAFLDHDPYTSLIQYARLDDLRAGVEPADKGEPMYRGPGIWMDPAVSPANPEPLHIRLSPGGNGSAAAGDLDPRRVRLAVSPQSATALVVRRSSHLRFQDLDVRFGGATLRLADVKDVTFDHVAFRTSGVGVHVGATALRTTFRHSEFDGGAEAGLVDSEEAASGILFDHCEFHDGRGLRLAGSHVDVHHSWMDSLGDEGITLAANAASGLTFHDNVVTRTAWPIVARTPRSGTAFIYRNLFDARGREQGRPMDTAVPGEDGGSWALFHNTFLARGTGDLGTYAPCGRPAGVSAGRSLNNIFVAVDTDDGSDNPVALLPSPSVAAVTDGNLYHRLGAGAGPLLLHPAYTIDGRAFDAGHFDGLADLRTGGDPYFAHSRRRYAPGYEASSIEADPQFVRIGEDGALRGTDDLRLAATSPARAAGLVLPEDLRALDAQAPTAGSSPDIGALPYGSELLAVGVDERRSLGPSSDPNGSSKPAQRPQDNSPKPGTHVMAMTGGPGVSLSPPPWSKASPLSNVMGTRRGRHPVRGAIHMHTVYSNDACYGDPRPNGGVNSLCQSQLADGLCKAHTDFVAFTDHNDTMADMPFYNLLTAAGAGTVLPAGGPWNAARAWLSCTVDGATQNQVVLTSAGTESGDLLPIMLDHHVTDENGSPSPSSNTREAIEARRRIYRADQVSGQLASFTADRERAAGGLVFTVHTESEPLWRIRATNPAGIEIYNLHADLDPAIRSGYLRDADWAHLPANGALESIAAHGFLKTPVDILSLFAPEPDLAFLAFMRPNLPALDKWDILLGQGRRLMGIGGTDSHQLGMPIALRDGEYIDAHRRFLRLFSNVVLTTTQPNNGYFDPAVLKADLSAGRMFVAFELLGTPVNFDMRATATASPTSTVVAEIGGDAAAGSYLQVTLPSVAGLDPSSQTAPEISARVFRLDPPTICTTSLGHCHCNAGEGENCFPGINMLRPTAVPLDPVGVGAGTTFSVPLTSNVGATRTAYRVEVYIKPRHLAGYLGLSPGTRALADPDTPYTWIYSNPIYVTPPQAHLEHYVFATSRTYAAGAIGSLAGADALCQAAAASPGTLTAPKGRTWKALVSAGAVNARARINWDGAPGVSLKSLTGEVIEPAMGSAAGYWPPAATPYKVRDEFGADITGSPVLNAWTGSNADGTASGIDCGGWTQVEGLGTTGRASYVASNAGWLNQAATGCNMLRRLYCVSQK